MKKLFQGVVLVLIFIFAVFSFYGCDKNHRLSQKEKALIEKAVQHQDQLTEDERVEFDTMVLENRYATNYYQDKKHEWNMRDYGKPSTAKPRPDIFLGK